MRYQITWSCPECKAEARSQGPSSEVDFMLSEFRAHMAARMHEGTFLVLNLPEDFDSMPGGAVRRSSIVGALYPQENSESNLAGAVKALVQSQVPLDEKTQGET